MNDATPDTLLQAIADADWIVQMARNERPVVELARDLRDRLERIHTATVTIAGLGGQASRECRVCRAAPGQACHDRQPMRRGRDNRTYHSAR